MKDQQRKSGRREESEGRKRGKRKKRERGKSGNDKYQDTERIAGGRSAVQTERKEKLQDKLS